MTEGYTPRSLAEALEMMATEELTPYAGGTDLMVAKEQGRPFLFLHEVEELRHVVEDEQYLRIGAAVTYAELLNDALTPALLQEAVATIAAPGIRNVGTLGGNIANASPKGDGALVCFATDSLLRLASSRGERIMPISEFYRGRGQTALEPDELLVEVLLPKVWLASGDHGFCKVGGRKALAISRVGFAGLFSLEDNRVAHLALAFGAVEDVVIRRPELDALLIGKTVAQARETVAEYLAAWDAALCPVQGRVSAAYRKQVCLNLTADFLDRHLGV
ncbi:MAG: FAD binding domain-containing protein [Coriobacteriia bacterium]|nr:FAD binding domain-containing protein [Coriobacteriia bacterium]